MKLFYNKTISYVLIVAFGVFLSQVAIAQCTTPITPTNIVVTETGPGQVSLSWDLDCGTRTECGANESLFWYVGFYGQNSPSQNGINGEYAVGNAITCDVPAGDVVNAPITNGGDVFGDGTVCLDQKGSTCTSSELGQLINGPCGPTPHTWNVAGMCSAEGAQNFLFDLCPGQCYNVFMWELVVGVPTDYGGNTAGMNCGIETAIACGEIPFIAESPVSDVVRICLTGTNELIGIPTVSIVSSSVGTTGGPAICATAGQAYMGEWEAQPEDEGDATTSCIVQDIDDETTFDAATCNITDSASGTQANNGNGGDTSVSSTPGAGNSANGDLTLGANVMEVNCRDVLEVGFSTPEGCNGVNDLNVFGLPICPGYDDTYTDAIIYISNNGVPVNPNTSNTAYPACVAAGDANAGDPGENGTIQCQNGSNTNGAAYPANYSAQFGAFLNTDDNCVFPIAGNPFEGGGSPFDFAGVTMQDFGDGVNRLVSTICVRYEDPCDGSKSATCVKFISDAAPMEAQVAACAETCPGASDGKIYVYDIVGGSDDPNSDGMYTDGNMGAYVLDVVSGPATGQIFTYIGGTTWEATGLAPGVYTIDIYDSLASMDTFGDDSDDGNAVCGATCPIQRVVEILPGPIISCAIENVVPGDCDNPGTATVAVDKLSIMSNGQVEFMGGAGVDGSGPVFGEEASTTAVSGINPAPCVDQLVGPTTMVEVCFLGVTTNGTSPGDASDFFVIGPGGSVTNVGFGSALGGMTDYADGDDVCFYTFAGNIGDMINGTWTVEAYNLYGGADFAFAGFTITFNDLLCVEELDITAFCATAGPDEGDMTGAIASADQTVTWASDAGGGEAAAEPFTYASLTGAGEEGLSFDMAAASAALGPGVTICYSMDAYVPGNNFSTVNDFTDLTGLATSCYVGACCQVICDPICFTTIACFDCIDPPPPVLTGDEICEADAATGFTATCSPCPDIAGYTGTSSVTWYSDAAGTAMVGTGGAYVPGDTAPGTYTYYATCTCSYNDPDASICESPTEMVDFIINPLPAVSIDNLSFGCGGGAQPLNPTPAGGVYSGSGAAVVMNDSVSDEDLSDGVTYDLTYTYSDANGCTASASITFQFNIDCEAEGGAFPSSGP